MLSFDEAGHRLLAPVSRLSSERVSVAQAMGRVLARDVLAPEPVPAFDHSAMDGYALDPAALVPEGPWLLPVAGESSAGADPPALTPGTACRIFTGARMPAGASAVVMQEHVHREGGFVRID